MPRKNEKKSQTMTTQLDLTWGNSGDDGRAGNYLGCWKSIGDKKSGKQKHQVKLRRGSGLWVQSACWGGGHLKALMDQKVLNGEVGKGPVGGPGLVLLIDDFCCPSE